jgi:hypothetical protein
MDASPMDVALEDETPNLTEVCTGLSDNKSMLSGTMWVEQPESITQSIVEAEKD